MVINTNTSAVSASRSLQHSSMMLSRSLARLSSGSRIVNPSDDAAGLAVSEQLSAQNSRVKAAQTNSQNAMSMLQTTDGFLQGMVSTLNRMSELSMMTRDVTKNANDIELYKTEFDQLKDQLRNIVGSGEGSDEHWEFSGSQPLGTFNGLSLFGPRDALTTVIGSSGNQTMSIAAFDLRNNVGSGADVALATLLWDEDVDSSQSSINVDDDDTIRLLTDAIQQVAGTRAQIGSVQSRLEFVDSQLTIQSQNLEAATSRIRDVDVAEESTRLAKYQILVQAGTSMLSQANSLPESVLRLLN